MRYSARLVRGSGGADGVEDRLGVVVARVQHDIHPSDPNALVEFHSEMREDPIELVLPERDYAAPRVVF